MRRNQHYQGRVNRVLDYISEHLDGDLSLARLSGSSRPTPVCDWWSATTRSMRGSRKGIPTLRRSSSLECRSTIRPSRLPSIAAMIWASPFRKSQAGFWGRSSAHGEVPRAGLRPCRNSPNAQRRALPFAISRPSRLSPSAALETLGMRNGRGTIYTGSGCRQAALCPRIYRLWNCLYGFRRK
jgi:hypothetical protein